MNNANQPVRACPALGLKDDAVTSLSFPSNGNYCHRSTPIATPRFAHQQEFCLGGKFRECPLFLSQEGMPLPLELRIPIKPPRLTGNNSRYYVGFFLVVLLVILAGGWAIARQPISPMGIGMETQPDLELGISDSRTPMPVTGTASLLPMPWPTSVIPVSTAGNSNTGTATSVNSRSPISPTSMPSKHQMEVPIGTEYKFVIHKVLDGENLDTLAARYDTSSEAIVSVNYGLTSSIWLDSVLVIPIGFSDYEKLPAFLVYQVKQTDRGISVESLAKQLRVNALELKYYNGWTNPGDRPLVGDLVLVPRRRSMP
jgi:hypothetical protein